MGGIDVCAMWPELFNDFDDLRREAVRQVFATEYLTGWVPDRAAVADLVELACERIDLDSYMSRSAGRTTSVPPPTSRG